MALEPSRPGVVARFIYGFSAPFLRLLSSRYCLSTRCVIAGHRRQLFLDNVEITCFPLIAKRVSDITHAMNTQPNRPRSTKLTRGKATKLKPHMKFRDITAKKDAKGGRTDVKDSHDRYD